MDSIPKIPDVSPLCVTGAKLILTLYEYIDEHRNVPRFVEELTGELCLLNASFTQMRILVADHQSSHKEVLLQSANDSKPLVAGCQETLKQLEAMIARAKIETNINSDGQLLTDRRWAWNEHEVHSLTERVKMYQSTIAAMMKVLSSDQTAQASTATDDFHHGILQIQKDEQHKPSFAPTVDKGHARPDTNPTIDFTATQPYQAAPLAHSAQAFRPLNSQLVDEVESKSWTTRCLKSISNWKDVPELKDANIRFSLKAKKVACLEISFSDDQIKALGELNRKYVEQKRAEFEALEPKPATTQATADSDKAFNDYLHEPGPFPPFFNGYKSGKIQFTFLFTVITHPSPCHILIAPSAHSHARRVTRGSLEIEFATPEDADEVFRLLRAVQEDLESSWKLHVLAFANVDPYLKTGSQEELLASAVMAEIRFTKLLMWWNALRGPEKG